MSWDSANMMGLLYQDKWNDETKTKIEFIIILKLVIQDITSTVKMMLIKRQRSYKHTLTQFGKMKMELIQSGNLNGELMVFYDSQTNKKKTKSKILLLIKLI